MLTLQLAYKKQVGESVGYIKLKIRRGAVKASE